MREKTQWVLDFSIKNFEDCTHESFFTSGRGRLIVIFFFGKKKTYAVFLIKKGTHVPSIKIKKFF